MGDGKCYEECEEEREREENAVTFGGFKGSINGRRADATNSWFNGTTTTTTTSRSETLAISMEKTMLGCRTLSSLSSSCRTFKLRAICHHLCEFSIESERENVRSCPESCQKFDSVVRAVSWCNVVGK